MVDGVTLVGHRNVPSRLAASASALYARNVEAFLKLIVEDGAVKIDRNDDIVAGTLLTHEGKVVNERVAEALPAKATLAKKPAANKPEAKKASPKRPRRFQDRVAQGHTRARAEGAFRCLTSSLSRRR